MAPVVFVVDMGVYTSRCVKKIKKDLMEIPGVVEVCVSLKTGHVAIVGMTDAATLGERLAARLRMPVFLLADFGAAPAPPVGGGYGKVPPPSPAPSSAFLEPTVGGGYQRYGYGVMPPPSSAPGSRIPAPPVGGYYNPYVGYSQLRYATPPPAGSGHGVIPPLSPAPSSPFPARRVYGGYQPYPYGYRGMPPPSPAPSSRHPAPPVGGYYNPYAGYNQPRYSAPPPESYSGYYYTPFGSRPWGAHYTRNDAPAATFEDEDHKEGCCYSIQ